MLRIALLLAVMALPTPALAHKVIAGVFASGSQIEGEVGFSNGDMAVGQIVEVFGPDGAKLGETTTDEDGFFLYTPSDPVAHRFRADLGAGHVADVTMSAQDVAKIMGVEAKQVAQPVAAKDLPKGAVTVASLSDQEQQIIAQIVRDETRPLRREIAAYKEKNDLQSILGGIGYIVGLFGLGFYIAARRKLEGQA